MIDLVEYQSFLFLLGSFFIPLFGVLAADFVLGAASPVAVRWSGLVAWLGGFVVYQWIQPTGPAFWTSWLGHVPDAGTVTTGASIPAFAVGFLLYAALRLRPAARPATVSRTP